MMLILYFFPGSIADSFGVQKLVTAAAVIVMPRSRSCSIQSVTVSPSCTAPIL